MFALSDNYHSETLSKADMLFVMKQVLPQHYTPGNLECKQHLWHTKMVGRCPTPAAARWSISCPTVPHSGSDSPCMPQELLDHTKLPAALHEVLQPWVLVTHTQCSA